MCSIPAIAQFVSDQYGISGEIIQLYCEVDLNYKVSTDDGRSYVVKLSSTQCQRAQLEMEHAVMAHLKDSDFPYMIPHPIVSKDGTDILKFDERYFRVLSFVEGRLLGKVNPRSNDILYAWGELCGHVSKSLDNFDHPFAHRSYHWNPAETLSSRRQAKYFNAEQKKIGEHFWNLFEEIALPKLDVLRKSVNYNDAHGENILTSTSRRGVNISGIIDFGDVLYCETMSELAIACAYAGMDMPDPIEAMKYVVKGYHSIFKLKDDEIELLFLLITARLLITVSQSALNKINNPSNKYLVVSEKPAWDLLQKLYHVHPDFAHYSFREACGKEPNPQRDLFNDFIETNKANLNPIVDTDSSRLMAIDLSFGSTQLGNNANFLSPQRFQRHINRLLEDHDATSAVGGYGEVRPVYTTDAFRTIGNQGAQWRTVHLGLDVWQSADSPIYAPTDGRIFALVDNAIDGDYGPTIIIEHRIDDEHKFYTLYGHLSRKSLIQHNIGDEIKAGEQIATTGKVNENGGWPPHVHVQIILNLFGCTENFPGVAYPHEASSYLSNSPDPAIYLKSIQSIKENISSDKIKLVRDKILGRSLSVSYNEPLQVVRGFKQYLYSINGRRYLDTVNNVAHVGHEHPRIVDIASKQIALLNTNTRYLHHQITSYAEALLKTFPDELSVVHFVNSGSEANELALRMMQAASGSKQVLAIESGYHGNTAACIDISSYKFDGPGGSGAPPHCHILPSPDSFAGTYCDHSDQSEAYAAHTQSVLSQIKDKGTSIGGFICESILSCGGQIPLPENYLKKQYELVREAGGICIADEVQVGFGRVGESFWAFELQGVVPDIVTLGKPIGNGHPLGAVITTKTIAEKFANGMEYFNTYGGNPVSCAMGHEVLRIIKDEKLQAHAKAVGDYLISELNKLKNKFPIIADIRGSGLFLGIELISPSTKKPAASAASYLVNRMRERGVLMSVDGPRHNVIKIKPPMCFIKNDADFLMENLGLVLREDAMQF